eukprot:529103-Amphidinium_carterae.1
MPGLVTILNHAECLGMWISFWAPCRGPWPFERKVIVVGLQQRFAFDPLSRTDMCSWPRHVNQKNCMEATIEHLAWLLSAKFAHYTFTIAALRAARRRLFGKRMRLESSHVLLQLSWLVATLCGPCLPILNTLLALLANIYSTLLFNCAPQLLDLKGQHEHTTSLPSFGFSTVALLALAFHSTNLL